MFTVFATFLSPYVQPRSLRLPLKQPHIDMCVCVSTAVIANKSGSRASQWELFRSNSSLGRRVPDRHHLYKIRWRDFVKCFSSRNQNHRQCLSSCYVVNLQKFVLKYLVNKYLLYWNWKVCLIFHRSQTY